jgi:exodeoxyribonuclease VII large subunit
VPVISAVGHERDSTLIDDVAAVACSTPTHAAEAAVPLDVGAARAGLERAAGSLRRASESAVRSRSRHLVSLARGPARALRRERKALNQKTREIRASSERGLAERRGFQRRLASVVLARAARRAAGPEAAGRREALHRAQVAFRAHEPERTLERGYALAEDGAGEPLTSAAAAIAAGRVKLRFADAKVGAEIDRDGSGG